MQRPLLSNTDNFYMEKLHGPGVQLDRVDFDSATLNIQQQPMKRKKKYYSFRYKRK